MLYWALMFFAVAILAAALGFGGLAVGSAGIAKMLSVLFIVLCATSLLGDRQLRHWPV
jgi:uncharacterized membrane protein YtjA (UPF0391 family)